MSVPVLGIARQRVNTLHADAEMEKLIEMRPLSIEWFDENAEVAE
jgi:hypothetical protein